MWVGVKRGQWHRMREVIEKVNTVQKENGGEMYYYSNALYATDAPDVALTFPAENWTDFDNSEYNMKEKYDEMYGEGSWMNAMRDWGDYTDYQSESIWVDVE